MFSFLNNQTSLSELVTILKVFLIVIFRGFQLRRQRFKVLKWFTLKKCWNRWVWVLRWRSWRFEELGNSFSSNFIPDEIILRRRLYFFEILNLIYLKRMGVILQILKLKHQNLLLLSCLNRMTRHKLISFLNHDMHFYILHDPLHRPVCLLKPPP